MLSLGETRNSNSNSNSNSSSNSTRMTKKASIDLRARPIMTNVSYGQFS